MTRPAQTASRSGGGVSLALWASPVTGGSIRVHQGDSEGIKGLCLINVVEEVTQFQAVFVVARISERVLLPVLEQLIGTFPFVIKGFQGDNGSECINGPVARLREKLRIE